MTTFCAVRSEGALVGIHERNRSCGDGCRPVVVIDVDSAERAREFMYALWDAEPGLLGRVTVDKWLAAISAALRSLIEPPEPEDLRVDLLLRVEQDEHMVRYAAAPSAPDGEEWRCRCGKHYHGEGAIEQGRRHVARKVLAALDEAGRVV